MSRVAKNPVSIPAGVEVSLQGSDIEVKSNNGVLSFSLPAGVSAEQKDNSIEFTWEPSSQALAGTSRSLVNNMIQGVSQGFEKKLTLIGVGYRAKVVGQVLELTLGFSHPVNFKIPDGITIETPSQTEVIVKGIDKQLVGQVAANIRAYRPPEPYKGKGVRYSNEQVVRKEAKKK
jgi:large subunit ribosomal protein L6